MYYNHNWNLHIGEHWSMSNVHNINMDIFCLHQKTYIFYFFSYIFHIYAPEPGHFPHIFALICPEFRTITNSIVPNSGYRCFYPYNWDYPQLQASNTTFSQWNSSIPTEMKITLNGIRNHVVLKQIVQRVVYSQLYYPARNVLNFRYE